ncbi:MAG: hypothetical protein VB082_03720 [Christensenella sp.]|nr:hypothetical protein [Christensenella sp.]
MRKEIEKKSIRSPEQLEEAIKISTPGVWVVVVLGILALGAFLLWASMGSIPTKVSSVAWVENTAAVMYIPEDRMKGIDTTKEVIVDGQYHEIISISNEPISAEELKTTLDDEMYYRLNPADWSYEVKFDAQGLGEGAKVASVVVEAVHPISFIFRSGE